MVSGKERAGAPGAWGPAPAHAAPSPAALELPGTPTPQPHTWGTRGSAQAGLGCCPGDFSGPGAAHQPDSSSTSPGLLIPLPHNKMSLNPWRPGQYRAPKASRCPWQCQNRGRSWAGLPRLRGDMGQPQEAWPRQAQLWAAPSPACAPGGCPRSPLCLQPGVPDISALGGGCHR